MKSISLAVVGCGDLALRCAAQLPPEFQLTGLCRSPERLPAGIVGRRADYTTPGDLALLEGLAPALVLLTLKPAAMSPEGYRAGFADAAREVLAGLGAHRPRRILMVSSTRVFAERDGNWVDEDSAVDETGYAARAILSAEHELRRSGHPFTAVRCAGIYGDPRGRLIARVRRGEICAPQPLRYSNRIHREDAAGFLSHLLQRAVEGERLEPVYIGADDEPAPRHEVEEWLAGRLGVDVPASRRVPPGGAGHKRCRNRLLQASGYRLRYPDFRAGYEAALASSEC